MKHQTRFSKLVRALLLCLVLSICAPLGAQAAGDDPELVVSGAEAVTVTYEVNPGLSWTYDAGWSSDGYAAYKAGNSGTNAGNISNISFKVTQPGTFSFDYRTSTYPGVRYALYYRLNQPVSGSSGNLNAYNNMTGEQPWTHVELSITADNLVDGAATVYVAYYRGGSLTGGENKVAIANVSFVSGSKTLNLSIDDASYGAVTGANAGISEVQAGDTVTLTATPENGGRFYGWLDGYGAFLSDDPTYSYTVSTDVTLQAVFAADGAYTARRGGTFFTAEGGGIGAALAGAKRNDIIVLLEDDSLSSDATVPSGATLYIPYSDVYDADGSADGTTASSQGMALDKTHATLTIQPGAMLTVNGTLRLGAVIGYPSNTSYQGHVSGAHGKIVNNGTISVANGGVMDTWGLVTGGGQVVAQSDATVYESFMVIDFAGGNNTGALYSSQQSPFKWYAMQNIQCTLNLKPGAKLIGRCNLYASGSYNKTDQVVFGPSGLFKTNAGTEVVRQYSEQGFALYKTWMGKDLGKTTYTVSGGGTFSNLSLNVGIVTVSTEKIDFPLPYNWNYVLTDGDYSVPGSTQSDGSVLGGLKVMPGSSLTVANDASLTVGGSLYVYDGLRQSDMSGKGYPTTDALAAADYPQSGMLTVDGTLNIASTARLGGVVQTGAASGVINIAEGARLTQEVRDGTDRITTLNSLCTAYDDNIADCTLSARVNTSEGVKHLSAGTWSAAGSTAWTLPDYTVTYRQNCTATDDGALASGQISGKTYYHKWVTETVIINQVMNGVWRSGQPENTILFVHRTVYDGADATRTLATSTGVNADGSAAFTVAATEAGAGYTWIVEYCPANSNEYTLLTPAADGSYSLAGISGTATVRVTGVKLGDINGDDKINSQDALQTLYISTGRVTATEIQNKAADVNRDSKINSADALKILYFSTGRINSFD